MLLQIWSLVLASMLYVYIFWLFDRVFVRTKIKNKDKSYHCRSVKVDECMINCINGCPPVKGCGEKIVCNWRQISVL